METFKPIKSFCGRAALLATACLIVPLLASEPRKDPHLAESELSRRSAAIDEAQELLRKGDEAYTAGNYAQAVEAYAGARDLIPNAPISAELRTAATERYAQASVEQARFLSRNGDVAGAKAVVDKVLLKSVAPDNPGALAMQGQLDDPIRTNPALNAKYTKDVDSVRRLIYTAEGAYNLGDFNKARSTYEDVLRIDPTNSAARRGMEQVAVAKSDYQKSAYDHSRAEMLGQVDSQWELQVPQQAVEPSLADSPGAIYRESGISVKNKLDRIFIPKIALDQASLVEALDFLRLRAAENDLLELDPARKGVNFTVNLGAPDSPSATKIRAIRFDLQLANVPLSQVLKYITDITRTTFRTDDFSVIISAAGSDSATLVSRTYRVPPDFISSISNGGNEPAAAAADPFSAAPASGGLLAERLGAKEALMKQGVAFPEGATASYTPATNSLLIVNTAANLDYIGQIIDTLTKTEPVMVALSVTMIKVQQTDLKELGFDWLLTNLGFGGAGWVPGSSRLNFDGGTVGNGRNLKDITLPPGTYTRTPITAGNRSGDSAISGNSIDNLINNPGGRQSNNPAPGIVGGYGNIDNATLQGLMRGLDQKKGTDVMAQPSTVTRSGQSASVKMVREFIYPSEYEPPELPNNTGGGANDIFGFGGGGGNNAVTPATPTAFKTRDVGITLEVLPVAAASKRFVNVTLNPSFVQFDGFVNYGSPINTTRQSLVGSETIALTENQILMPIFSKQSFTTSVDVADGANLVIGGLTQESVQNVADHTPILGSVPIIGRLFQTQARHSVTTAIIFLINVEIIDPTGRRYRDR